jgi:hypothetical protein
MENDKTYEELENELNDAKTSLTEWESTRIEIESPRLSNKTCHFCCQYKIPKKKLKDFPPQTPVCQGQCKKSHKPETPTHSWEDCPTHFRIVHLDAPKLKNELEIKKNVAAVKKKIYDLNEKLNQVRKKQNRFSGNVKWNETIKKIRKSAATSSGNGVLLNNVLEVVRSELKNHNIDDNVTSLEPDEIQLISKRVLGVESRANIVNKLNPNAQKDILILKKESDKENVDKNMLEKLDCNEELKISEQIAFLENQRFLLKRKRLAEDAKEHSITLTLFPHHRPKSSPPTKQRSCLF